MTIAMRKLNATRGGSSMRTSSADNSLNDIVAKAILRVLDEPLDWSKLYSLSWIYALAQSIYLQEDELYSNLKNAVLMLLDDEKKFRIAIYDHEGAVGILFSLYHIADRESITSQVVNKVLDAIEKLQWHEFDGEVMVFSYMLASKMKADEHVNNLKKYISNNLNNWFELLDYDSQKNSTYVLFGFAYILDDTLVDIIKEFKLYSDDSYLLRKIIDSYDVELIALILYVLGKLAYNNKLKRIMKKKIGKNAIRIIRQKSIPFIGEVLTKRIYETYLQLGEDIDMKSLPLDLLAKIQLAKIESGLDKPFMLSKFEWKIYQETLKALERGYYRVRRHHLFICLILDSILSSILALIYLSPIFATIVTDISKYLPYNVDAKWVISSIILNLLYGINISLVNYGSIRKEYLLGIVKHLLIDIPKMVKKH